MRRKKPAFGRILLLLIMMMMGSAICTSCKDDEEEKTYDDSPQGNLTALWTIIDQKYCFLTYKEKELGFKWADVYVKYSSRLNPRMSRAQLFEVLCDMIGELKDGHVNLNSSIDMGRNWSWKEDYPVNLNTELRDSYLTADYHIAGGMRYCILPDNVGYMIYDSFGSATGEGNLDDMLNILRLCNGLIIDVRGNGGGDLTNAERVCRRFTNTDVLVGFSAHKTGPGHDEFSTPVPEVIKPSNRIRWQKKVVVLTNRSCYSAANTFVRNMKEMPLVTIMGDKTGGGSGMPFTSEIPIGWSVRYSACPSYDARMQQTEFGIEPDIYASLDEEEVKRGKDSMIEAARSFLCSSR